jgi:hypothetical protein
MELKQELDYLPDPEKLSQETAELQLELLLEDKELINLF